MTPVPPQLFASVKYFVTADVPEEITSLLKEGGAKKEFYIFSDLVTHVITESANFLEKDDCTDKLTVKSTWVRLSHQLGYLLPTQPFTVCPPGLLDGAVVCTSGIKGDDYYAVWSMVHWNGGSLVKCLSNNTTHLIVGASQNVGKYKAAVANNIPVVVVEWLIESIESGSVLSTDNYTLHVPGHTPPRPPSTAPSPRIPQQPSQSPRISLSPRITSQQLASGSQQLASGSQQLLPSSQQIGQMPIQSPHLPMLSPGMPGMPGMQRPHLAMHSPRMQNPLVPPSPLLAQAIRSPNLISPDKEEEKVRKRAPKKNSKKKKEPVNNVFPMTPAMIGAGGVGYPHTPSPLPPTPSPAHTPNTVSPDRFNMQQQQQQQQQQGQYMMQNNAQYMQYQQQMRQGGAYPGTPTGAPPQGPPNNANRQQWNLYQQQMLQQKQKQAGYFQAGQFAGGQLPPGYPGRTTPTNYPAGMGPGTPVARSPQGYPTQPTPQQQQPGINNQVIKAAPTPPPEHPELKESRFTTLKNCTLMLIDYPEYYSRDIMNKWKIVIEEHGGQTANFYNPEYVTHIICMSRMSDIYKRALEDGKCVTTAHWLNDVVIGKEYISPHNPLHIPTQFKTGLPDCAKMKISVTGYEGKERTYVKDMIRVIGAVYTGELSQQNTHLISRKSEGLKFTKAQKWSTKVVNARWLSDIVLYGVVSVTTEKKYTTLGDPKEMVLQDSVMPKLVLSWHNFNQNDANPEKQMSPVILFTGLPSDKNQKLTQMIKRMRCKLTTDVREATHLVTCKIVRTVKFLSAMSQCKFIVTPAWIEQSCQRKMLSDESSYILDDKESEQTLGFCVRDSLAKARNGKILKDVELFFTQHIQPGPRDMRIIVECAGGTVISEDDALARINQPTNQRKTFYVISCSADQMVCQQFYQKEVQIYTSEFVLSASLNQELNFNSNKLFVQDYKPEENSQSAG